MSGDENTKIRVGLAQIAPVWLQKRPTLEKVLASLTEAAAAGCSLVAFGEALVPGYPFWVERSDGARFDSDLQKSLYAHYVAEAVSPGDGDLEPVCRAAAGHGIAVYLGTVERATDRGGHSLYCSMVHVTAAGEIASIHRKLMPTYEERLVWSIGDGHGLRTHRLGPFTAGGLNCWENWLPLARAALYAQGEDLHVAIWPGNRRNTEDITRFVARESRSYVMSVSGLLRSTDIDPALPHAKYLVGEDDEVLADGGSCLADPRGDWLVAPFVDTEALRIAEIDLCVVNEERQNLDPVGHYSRPDITRLTVDRRRQSTVTFED